MKIVFFGTSDFAEVVLKELLKSRHEVKLVVTQPDRKKGRHLHLSPPPTKALAISEDIRTFQPEDASGTESIEFLKNVGADLFVVVAFGQILKREVLGIPKYYSINLHTSLLPKYRGAAPVNWAIMNGDAVSGVTIIKMNERMDEGDVIVQKEVKIEREDTGITLNEKLSELGAKVLIDTIDLIEEKKESFHAQNGSLATYAPKLKKEGGIINWSDPAEKICNKVRGLMPWPGAYTSLEGKTVKIWKAEVTDILVGKGGGDGQIVDVVKGKGIVVRTGSGNLVIQHLQLEGKKILSADEFLRGHRVKMGSKFCR
ncbi:MAG: methionyl-tRNA formyltransferase [Candidatus Omnitrophota bacterium]